MIRMRRPTGRVITALFKPGTHHGQLCEQMVFHTHQMELIPRIIGWVSHQRRTELRKKLPGFGRNEHTPAM